MIEPLNVSTRSWSKASSELDHELEKTQIHNFSIEEPVIEDQLECQPLWNHTKVCAEPVPKLKKLTHDTTRA